VTNFTLRRTQNVLTVTMAHRNGNFILFIPTIGYTKLVGTEIAHAVPLTLVAGLGHASMGNLDLGLLGQL
jgi:hypothetical protein